MECRKDVGEVAGINRDAENKNTKKREGGRNEEITKKVGAWSSSYMFCDSLAPRRTIGSWMPSTPKLCLRPRRTKQDFDEGLSCFLPRTL